jgi:hypothetical protein
MPSGWNAWPRLMPSWGAWLVAGWWRRWRRTVDAVSTDHVLAAARIKAVLPLAYGDSFAVATAAAHGAGWLAGDPEMSSRRRSRGASYSIPPICAVPMAEPAVSRLVSIRSG